MLRLALPLDEDAIAIRLGTDAETVRKLLGRADASVRVSMELKAAGS